MRRILAAVALTASLASLASAQTVDEIIAKNVAARGGMDKLKSVKTVRMTGTMTLGQGMEAPFTLTMKRPNRSRMEFTVQGLTGVQAYDGKTAWALMPFSGRTNPETMTEEDSKQMSESADFDGPLIDYAAKGNKVELLGKDKLEGTDAWKVKLTLPSGATRTVWIDAESFLELGADGKRTMRGTEVEFKSTMSDYKDVGGILVAHTMSSEFQGPHGSMVQTMAFSKVEYNVPAADTLFDVPAGAKPASPPPSAAPAASQPASGAPAAPSSGAMTTAGADTAKKAATKPTKTAPKKP